MSIAILNQVYEETRRLAIAGSVVAPNDFRLKKLIEPLAKAGEKAPVFARVADAMTKVVDSSEKTSAEALLELSTLVNAILYTQGETGLAGKLEPIETVDLGPQETQTSARRLKPLLEALTTTGSGRLETIRESFELGAFRDLRLVKPALAALDDKYPEISEFIGQRVLPLYGKAILPELQAKLDLKGKGGHLRRLTLMHALDPEGTRPIVKKALDEGSKEMKVVAIECLGDAPDDLSFLLDQAKAKAREVRQAALKALGKSKEGGALAALHSALQGNDLELAVEPVRESRHPRLLPLLVTEAQEQFERLIAGKEKDKKKLGEQVLRMLHLLECFRGRDDKQSEAFLLQCFAAQEQLGGVKADPGGKDLVERLVDVMSTASPPTRQALIDQHARLPPEQLPHAFLAARRSLKPAKVFELFSPYLTAKVDEKKKARDPAYNRREAILSSLIRHWHTRYFHGLAYEEDELDTLKDLDPRWLDVAVEIRNLDLIQSLARPGHAGARQALSEAMAENRQKSREPYKLIGVLATMIDIEHPEATDALLSLFSKQVKTMHGYWVSSWLGRLIPRLPKSAVPKLEELLTGLPEKVTDQLLEPLAELKARP